MNNNQNEPPIDSTIRDVIEEEKLFSDTTTQTMKHESFINNPSRIISKGRPKNKRSKSFVEKSNEKGKVKKKKSATKKKAEKNEVLVYSKKLKKNLKYY